MLFNSASQLLDNHYSTSCRHDPSMPRNARMGVTSTFQEPGCKLFPIANALNEGKLQSDAGQRVPNSRIHQFQARDMLKPPNIFTE
ncbi:hypothetical protein sscle_14g102200 [Sclerotinia sclerotiorum 1980 UF-70]|uniref:Uncharacterized protein n=1 Tax=Sclerotinia sclerotiorum (strain ATCC 18683 / 1980 / Ss-1) TaxID=665079 RepID=A0A1D9QKH7_SCLS1|nr:hypothetical protein sscle_14g102200 [Sclerotinia sclerotiorum 1980 UF-70]